MSSRADFSHVPVMLDEVVELLGAVPGGVLLDGTLGGGGHAGALLAARPDLHLVGLDRDPDALAAARAALAPFAARVTLRRANFAEAAAVLDSLGIGGISAALLDLGVSSWQLDRAERGFSYRLEGPLDMRMDPETARNAADVVNSWSEGELAELLAEHGEGRFARRIARCLVAARPLATTTELAEVVRAAIPAAARRHGGHPARRTFQALRVAVNGELDVLADALDALLARLVPGGRIVVLAYHSGEDRIVKDRLRWAATGGCTCPPGLPCGCGAEPTVALLGRGARRPSAGEVAANRRAESARLRAAERRPPSPSPDTAASLPAEDLP